MDCNIESLEPVKPPPLESTPFKMVEEVKDLKELAAKLRSVTEFAVSHKSISSYFMNVSIKDLLGFSKLRI